jgi:acetyltransferase-like isoleucine patch superfamily enzyme
LSAARQKTIDYLSAPPAPQIPGLVYGTGAPAWKVARELLKRGHLVQGFLDDEAPDPREGNTMLIQGIEGSPERGLVAAPPQAWASRNNLDDHIVVVVAASEGGRDIEASVTRMEAVVGDFGCKRVINFYEICETYPECGIRPPTWFRSCLARASLMKASPLVDVSIGFASYVDGYGLYIRGGAQHEENRIIKAKLTIGAFTAIAAKATILLYGGTHGKDCVTVFDLSHLPEIDSALGPADKTGVTIGSDVWIGTGVMILPGIVIGDGAIVGAGSVVSRDVEPYAVVAGNPAQHKRHRFPQREREALLQARWWDWPWEEIQRVIPLLFSPRIEDFLHYAATRPEAPRDGALASFAA